MATHTVVHPVPLETRPNIQPKAQNYAAQPAFCTPDNMVGRLPPIATFLKLLQWLRVRVKRQRWQTGGGGVMADENTNLEYEQWFLAQVALGLAEADDLATVWVSDDEAGASLAAKRTEWQARAVWSAA